MDDNPVLKPEEAACQTPNVQFQLDLHPSLAERQRVAKRDRQQLTNREGTIVAFIGTGRSNKEIARELGVTPETIKSHLKRIFLKLSASTRAEAVFRAQNIDLFGLPTSMRQDG
jgi:LuxR family transcriptional regulator, maltose regulon positive regulatory protein